MEHVETKANSLSSTLETSRFATEDETEYGDSKDDEYDISYFDWEKGTSASSNRRQPTNGATSVKFETDAFDLGTTSDYDDNVQDHETPLSSLSSSLSPSSSSLASHSSSKTSLSSMPRRPSNSKIPIRNVLDIFQELKLSFGRAPQR